MTSLVKCSLGMQEALILIPSTVSNPSTPPELEAGASGAQGYFQGRSQPKARLDFGRACLRLKKKKVSESNWVASYTFYAPEDLCLFCGTDCHFSELSCTFR